MINGEVELKKSEHLLEMQMKHAELMAQSNMIPEKFKGNPANVLVAKELAEAMGETPWVTMSELYFVGNVPTFSAKYMRSRVRAAGHILRESFDRETMTATCIIIRKDDPDYEHVVTWNQKKAKDHGLWGRGHWAKNPELMLKNRAVSECVREACNEVMGGVDYTREEAEAMAPVKATAKRMDGQGQERGADAVRAALEAKKQQQAGEDRTQLDKALAALAQVEDREHLDRIITHAQGIGMAPEQLTELAEAAAARAEDLPVQEVA